MTPINIPKFKLKKDSYQKRRGTPKMLTIFCVPCNVYVMSYQKDGPGPLLRCYLDRIHHPDFLESRQYVEFNKRTASKLICETCKEVIGVPIIYDKENRPAYHMRQGFFCIKPDLCKTKIKANLVT
jgi:hypothetical protein